MGLNEEIQRYVKTAYLEPAKRRGESTIRITAGDVHRDLHWINRVPSVCTTLSSKKFQKETGLELISKEGPPSGFGTRAQFLYRVQGQEGSRLQGTRNSRLEALYGKLSDVLRELGGGEEIVRSEREQLQFQADDRSTGGGQKK